MFDDQAKSTRLVVPSFVRAESKTSPIQLKSKCVSELSLRLARKLPSSFRESGTLREPPRSQKIKAKK